MGAGGCQLQLVWARVDDGDTSPIILLLSWRVGCTLVYAEQDSKMSKSVIAVNIGLMTDILALV